MRRFATIVVLIWNLGVVVAPAWPDPPALPIPTGSQSVGTTYRHLVDASRANPGAEDDAIGRDLMIQIWYPCRADASGESAPYLPDARLADVLVAAGFYEQDEATLRALASVQTHSILDAPFAIAAKPRTLLVFSHGLGFPRWAYTSLAEEMASHGYVVVAIDHPAGGLVMLPDGSILDTDDDPAFATEDGFGLRVEDWAADAIFVVDRLKAEQAANKPRGNGPGPLDFTRIGAFGHSMGGLAALRACCLDDRFVAAANLDGGPLGEIQASGTCAPALHMTSQPDYSEADNAKRGRTGGEWEEMGRQREQMWSDWMAKSRARANVVSIRGTGHMSFSDAPFVMPDLINRFGGRIIDAARGRQIVSEMLQGFFNRTLRGREVRVIEDLARPFEEVTLTTHSP